MTFWQSNLCWQTGGGQCYHACRQHWAHFRSEHELQIGHLLQTAVEGRQVRVIPSLVEQITIPATFLQIRLWEKALFHTNSYKILERLANFG